MRLSNPDLMFFRVAVLATLCGLAACKPPAPQAAPEESPFLNTGEGVAYVGDAACAQCHEKLVASYQTHGMAQSYYPLTAGNAVEAWPGTPVYHRGTNLYYRAYRANGKYYQEEYRMEGGRKTHELVREMKYVMGSGSAARTYFDEENAWYHQLPLSWYTQEKKWDFSPGYRQANARFDRLVPTRCMTCHNAYPDAVPFTEGKYTRVPQGISCERCHGPGALHVEERLASPDVEGVDYTIVNPEHLPFARRMDVCGQCHLQSAVSLLREGQDAFSFRPGMALDAYQSLYAVAGKEDEGRIRVISHSERMQRSACFVASRTMDCVTCHDPHEGFRDKGPAYFNDTCLGCHAPAALEARFAGTPAAPDHQPQSNCTGCHMPKVSAVEAPHSSFTDHWIRVVKSVPAPPDAPRADVELVPYFARDQQPDRAAALYAGMAYVVYGQQQGSRQALEKGARQLEKALEGEEGAGEAYYLLGFARYQLGEVRAALPALEKARALGPRVPERLNTLALAYEATGAAPGQVLPLYEEALRIQPALAEVRVNYGRYLEKVGRLDAAAAQYDAARRERPWLETAYYNLGTLRLQQGDAAGAEALLQQAVRLDPDNAQARGNLGLLLAGTGRAAQARVQFEAALRADSSSIVALGNLGTFYLNEGQPDRARPLLEKAVARNPAFLDGLVNLAILHLQQGRAAEAGDYARRVLLINPDEPRARQILAVLGG